MQTPHIALVGMVLLAACGMRETTRSPASVPGATATPPADRIYTDGALSNPQPKAEDLGMSSPGTKITVDSKPESR